MRRSPADGAFEEAEEVDVLRPVFLSSNLTASTLASGVKCTCRLVLMAANLLEDAGSTVWEITNSPEEAKSSPHASVQL